MKTILFSSICNQPVSLEIEGGYFVDGVKPVLEEGLVELEVVSSMQPHPNATMRWERQGDKYVKVWDYNPEEWLHSGFALRIVAPKKLVLVYPQFYIWFQVNDLPVEKVGDSLHLYCNSIEEEHQVLVNSNKDFIQIQDKPIN